MIIKGAGGKAFCAGGDIRGEQQPAGSITGVCVASVCVSHVEAFWSQRLPTVSLKDK